MTNAISRALLGKIVDEVFDGAIEDPSVIEEIYAVIKREEADLSAAEPVAAMTTDYLGCEYVSMDVAGIEKIAAAHSKGPTEVVYLYAAPPAPSVAVEAPRADWIKHDGKSIPVNGDTVVEVRMASGFEYEAEFASNWLEREGSKSNWHHDRGCPHPCDIVAYRIVPNSAALSAQVQDVAETEAIAALKEAEPYVEICHSLMTQKVTRANVWRVLKQVRAAIAAAPAKQEGGK